MCTRFELVDRTVSVARYRANETIPTSAMTPAMAKQELGMEAGERGLLFFGQIAPYKGVEYLIAAVAMLAKAGQRVRVIVAGKGKRGSEDYWRHIQRSILDFGIGDLVVQKIHFIPDDEVENYFKAADAVVIPYVNIFQSGVPFLAFSFGLPVIATDVGSLREDITNETGFLWRPKDPGDLARAIAEFYQSGLLQDQEGGVRVRIRRFAAERHSWETVGERTNAVYASLTRDRQNLTLVRSSTEPQGPSPHRNARNSGKNPSDPVLPHSRY